LRVYGKIPRYYVALLRKHMHIILNGDPREYPDSLSASQLLQDLGLTGKRLALEINREIVPRSTFDSHIIQPGDRIEIVRAIGGG
ncbi:MAG: sulfur carrier protein ThiS, partial [Gammaproteobacteria bacterium]